jgi:hypothetical protein
MTQPETLLTESVADLVRLTAELKSLLAADRAPETLTEICGSIAATATAMTQIDPVPDAPSGLYATWLALVLALEEATKSGFEGGAQEALDGAIGAVRIMRRTYGIAPGGA